MQSLTQLRSAWDQYHATPALQLTIPYEWMVKFVSRAAQPGACCLDIGAGSGNNAVWLARRGCNVVAIDFAPHAETRTMALAENFGVAERIQFLVGDASDTAWVADALKPHQFDLVIMHQILDHVRKEEASGILQSLRGAAIEYARVFASFLTESCAGSLVRGTKDGGSYLSPISESLDADCLELHSFYSFEEINRLCEILADHCITRSVTVTDEYTGTIPGGPAPNVMQTCVTLLEPKA